VEIKLYNISNFLSQLKVQALIDANSIMPVFVIMTQVMLIVPIIVASFVQHFKCKLAQKEIENLNSKIEDVVYLSIHKLHLLQFIITPQTSQWLL
jgi:uncharacterized membrane protein YjgN (DUF898 family)